MEGESKRGLKGEEIINEECNHGPECGVVPVVHSDADLDTESQSLVEIYRNVYQIRSLFGDRNLFQYLFAGEKYVLIDSGIADTPKEVIFPSLRKLGIRPTQIALAVTTHADADHQGGNFAIRQASPQTLLACGRGDQTTIEDPWSLWSLRYNFLKADYGVGIDPDPSPAAGRPCKMDICFTGGEKIRLGNDWELDVHHVPGHSYGHLAFYDRKHKTAFVGDAIHGRGCPGAKGKMALPVTYYYVDAYLSTLNYIEQWPIDVLFTGHWPAMRGKEISNFIAESRQTVETLDRVILKCLATNLSGLTMKELVLGVAESFRIWPKNTWIFLMFSIKGHMDRLEQQGKARKMRERHPFRWVRN